MLDRIRSILQDVSSYLIWLVLAIAVTFTCFQIHGAIIGIGWVVVQNPDLRPMGWSTNTIYGLSRFAWLVVGIFWLGWVIFTEGYLREGREYGILKERTVRLAFILAGIFIIFAAILYFVV